ncbi:MAG TPA: class I SAM-dependent methyltransferase [Proteiniclasticum sp.]|uniref:class I SAM-dependent methyltransferase n=1 Tax=Proteiniclasticum sp. TaxID=2053595 RepID=UPI000E99C7C6|nr:class I SAM-dependent methyltransferase [Proteiniclasticum sp.]HBW14427.1 class I SAM-dependent methyltransferase [Proteiniclasticum sp.]
MKFYEILEKHYDFIFPFQKSTYDFIRDGLNPQDKVLDVACGTGTYTIALRKEGILSCGLDLEESMIRIAEKKAEEQGIQGDFIVSNMLDMDLVHEGGLRRIFIIGNSLVHLNSMDQIKNFITTAYSLLHDEGDLMIQIINYDRILKENIDHLPTIHVPDIGLTFKRNYKYDAEAHLIDFSSQLSVHGETEEASVQLFPLKKEELVHLLMEVGFEEIHLYGSFKKEPYTESSTPLIVVAKKKLS